MAAYKDFFDENGDYILRDEMRRVDALKPIDRGMLEKDLIKVDERVNILNMVFSGQLFKIVPVPGDPNDTWAAAAMEGHNHDETQSTVAERFFAAYVPAKPPPTTTTCTCLVGSAMSAPE